MKYISPIDREVLRDRVKNSHPVQNFCIDNFLEPDFAESVLAAYPSFEDAMKVGKSFKAVNERGKVQVTDSSAFAEPVAELNRTLASPEFTGLMSYVFDIPNLLPDPDLVGGGIHQTGPRGHLDVHVDFNYIEERALHRRLNILIYFNKDWKPEYGGNIELWDADVKECHHSFMPIFNRCVVFETNEVSYHGVTAVKCPEGRSRKSFAAYYYTSEAPAHWTGEAHSTIFRARPDEVLKGNVMMPLEKARRQFSSVVSGLKAGIKRTIMG
ncbi:2OG-Fe(II) oxygenase [Tundrisphaera sp. TA3]|uniref:2OG-Fe(II) oxygenase n=1 Tax=Tundrisphaera sp. TA3 TaxID=3435775 RepID=UPI003EBCF0EA